MRLLIRVVEAGSVQRAAQQLGISRSSLRRKLETLEEQVGSELLVRSASGVVLTAAGEIVVREGFMLLDRYTQMLASLKASSAAPTGRLVVVVPLGIPEPARLQLLQALHVIAPGLCVVEREEAEPLAHLRKPFDLMFHFEDPPESGTWFTRVVRRAHMRPVASQAYLDTHGCPSSPADLAKHRLLGWEIAGRNPTEWPLLAGGVLHVDPVFCSRDGQLLLRAAQAGMGILLGDPDPALLVDETPLVSVLEAEIGYDVALRCLSPIPSTADPRSGALLKCIHEFMTAIAQNPPD